MKFTVRRLGAVVGLIAGTVLLGSVAPADAAGPNVAQTPGLDVSAVNGTVDWPTVAADGAKFAYIKATDVTNYTNPDFDQQYNGAAAAGLVRGAYTLVDPGVSGGAGQADYFIAHGGGWSADGRTLPGALDIEWNPYGTACYGLSQAAMAGWLDSFVAEYHAKEGVYPVIATATSWWDECVGAAGGFGSIDPLWIVAGTGSIGTPPTGWRTYTFWHYADSGTFPGGQDYFNGTVADLQAFAKTG